MTKILMVCATATALMFTAAAPQPAEARDGAAVAAGVLGGLVVGGMIGAAAAQQSPPPAYYAPAPVYRAPPPRCYMARGEPVWDDYRGAWVRPRVRVCE